MGSDLKKCQLGLDDPEVLEQVFKSIPFCQLEIKDVLKKFSECYGEKQNSFVIKELSKSSTIQTIDFMQRSNSSWNTLNDKYSLDYNKYNLFISDIINKDTNLGRVQHLEYFDNLKRVDLSVQVISTILITICKGSKDEKIQLLTDMYSKCSETLTRDSFQMYIYGVIQANTELPLESFVSLFQETSYHKFKDVYNEIRKKKLCEFIMTNFDSIIIPSNNRNSNNSNNNDINSNDVINLFDENNLKKLKEVFRLIYNLIEGEYIRGWLYDEYEKSRPKSEGICCT